MEKESTMRLGSWTAWPALLAWFLSALAVAGSGLLLALPRPVTPALIFGLVGAGVAWYRRSAELRSWVAALDLRLPVAYQLVRLAYGLLFLENFSRGLLPASFALTAGYGDVAAGSLGLVTIAVLGSRARWKRGMLWLWSVVGLVDMVIVVLTAQRLIVLQGDERMLAAFTQIHFALLPTFVVPLIFLTHGAVLARLLGDPGAARLAEPSVPR
jgi:hypothetical protein